MVVDANVMTTMTILGKLYLVGIPGDVVETNARSILQLLD